MCLYVFHCIVYLSLSNTFYFTLFYSVDDDSLFFVAPICPLFVGNLCLVNVLLYSTYCPF